LSGTGVKALYLRAKNPRNRSNSGRTSVRSVKDLYILSGTCIEQLFERIETLKPNLLIIDSIQTVYTEALPSAPGSVGQVREVSTRLLNWAKKTGVPTLLVGHVTKDGAIAGQRFSNTSWTLSSTLKATTLMPSGFCEP